MKLSGLLIVAAVMAAGCGGGGLNSADQAAEDSRVAAEATSCYGTFSGNVAAPSKSVRINARNAYLTEIGYVLTGDDEKDNKATGGGGVDGGMYLEGKVNFITNESCAITSGDVTIYNEKFTVYGTVKSDRTFDLSYGLGKVVGRVNSGNTISGTVKDGSIDKNGKAREYIQGVLSGTFIPTSTKK